MIFELRLLQKISFATAVFLFLKGVNHAECNRGDLFISNWSFNLQTSLGTQEAMKRKEMLSDAKNIFIG